MTPAEVAACKARLTDLAVAAQEGPPRAAFWDAFIAVMNDHVALIEEVERRNARLRDSG